jgi:hypothetical protein
MKKIIVAMLGLSIALLADFTKEGDIVTDSVTKLEWQDDAITDTMEWQEAIEYCEGLELEEHTDWRLPNINELKTIIDRSRYNPAIVSAFEQTSSSYYWSSTTYEGGHEDAWAVCFDDGYVSYDYKDYDYYVRCVRAGQ